MYFSRSRGHAFVTFSEGAGEKSADQLRLLGDVDQKGVVAVIRRQFAERHVAIAPAQRADDLERLIGRVEPVRGEADHQKARLRPAPERQRAIRARCVTSNSPSPS